MGTRFCVFLIFFSILEASLVLSRAAHGAPPKVLEGVERKFRIPVGQKLFRLVCPVVAGEKEMLMVEWEKNGEQIEWDSRYKMARDNRELRMKNVRLEDSGRYQCQATNGFGHQTIDFTVHVYDPEDSGVTVKDKLVLSNSTSAPNWLIDMNFEWSSPIQVNRGGRIELRCPARGNPMPEIRWYKNNMLLNSDAPAHIASFVVDPASPEDSGNYRCLVENRLGSIDAVFKVVVDDIFEDNKEHIPEFQPAEVGVPEPEIDLPYNISVKVGHTAQFQCKAKASESPLIKWLKEVSDPVAARSVDPNATIVSANGMHLLVLDQNQVESITKDASENLYTNKLVIPAVTKAAAGRYICVVTSSQGHIVYKSAQLNVTSALDLSMSSPELIWIIGAMGIVLFIFIVACAIITLRKFQEPSSPMIHKPPPPPKIPPPMAPAPYTPSMNRSFNHDLDKTRSPVMLNNAMFQQRLPAGIATLDRKKYVMTPRGYDEMSHVYDCSSPQPYWQVRNQPVYTPPSSNYRTLDVGFGRTHPSMCSEEYAEQEPFISYRR